MKRGAVDVMEAAYREAPTAEAWLREIANHLPQHKHGLGIVCNTYKITDEGRVALDLDVTVGSLPDMGELTRTVMGSMPPEYVRETWATVPCSTAMTAGSAATRSQTRAAMAHFYGGFGIKDIIVVNGIDPTGEGVYFGNMLSDEVSGLTRREIATWSRVAAHLAAGFRLRRLQTTDGDAVITPSGRIEHALGDAKSRAAQTSLRDAAMAIDRARSKRQRNGDDAVDLWHALVAGQWTLIDRVDRDGKRFFIARQNDPSVAEHHRLTRRERQVVGYAALGHSNKLIAYEMGLSPSTVGVYLDVAIEKLGLQSRAALIVAARAFQREAT